MELMVEEMGKGSDEGGAARKCLRSEEGIRQINGHEIGGKRVDTKHSKHICSMVNSNMEKMIFGKTCVG